MITIRPLSNTSLNDIFTAWDQAFSGYVRTWTQAEFENDMKRRGFVPALSFGAFDGEKLVSFILNGIGPFNGIQTAYDTGTGTIPDYRGQGLVAKIFHEAVPVLNQQEIKQYLLEVLQDNSKAISVYANLGFKVSREFNYFVQAANEVKLNNKTLPAGYELKTINFKDQTIMTEMWDFDPSWQNSFDSLSRKQEDFITIGAFNNSVLVGYGVIAHSSGDIPQLAVHKEHRRKGIASAILKELLAHNKSNTVKFINTGATCTAITSFIEANGIAKSGMQYEMIKSLN